MASVGELFVQIGADLSEFEKAMQRVEQNMKKISKKVEQQGTDVSDAMEESMEKIQDSVKRTQREVDKFRIKPINTKDIDSLPDHLRPFGTSLKATQDELKQTSRTANRSFEEIQDAASKTNVGFSKMTSVTETGKKITASLEEVRKQTNKTKMAIYGLSENGKVKLSTEEAKAQMAAFEDQVQETRKELDKFKDAGDFAAYEAGMRGLDASIMKVNKSMGIVARGGRGLEADLMSMGIVVAGIGDASAISMERMKDSFIMGNQRMQEMETTSSKLSKSLAEMNVRSLDRQFLKVGDALERLAKKGTVANVALKELGEGASMKEIMAKVQQINQGIARMTALQIGMGIAVAATTALLGKAAYGPDPGEVRKQQAEITQAYKDALDQRAADIYNFASLFEDVELVKVNKDTLIKNLDEQVDILEDWASNLGKLAKRGVDEGMIAELQQMGPKAAGEIQALTSMTDGELNKYVKLWKEKHRLARTQAMSELEQLKEQTKQKVADLEASLQPLGIAVERFKSVWAEALRPFIEQWGMAAAKVVDFGTKIGEMIKKFGEAHPQMQGLIGNFMYLFMVMSLILSPMALGISRAGAMAIAFNKAFTFVKMFAIGLLSVAGTATIIAGSIAGITYALVNMWNHSEAFRSAMAGLWTGIKAAWDAAMDPLKEKFSALATTFQDTITSFLGGATSFTDRWQTIGDVVGGVIRMITPLIVNGLGAAFTLLAFVGGMAIDLIKLAIEQLAIAFQNNGTQIQTIVQGMSTFIMEIFSAVGAFLMEVLPPVIAFIVEAWTEIYNFILSIMPQIQELVSTAFTIIGEVVTTILPKILEVVRAVLPAIQAIFEFVFPLLLAVVKEVWTSVKAVITAGLDIILNLVNIFKGVMAGDWSAVWDNVVDLVKNAFTLVWNAIQLIWLGKAVKGVVAGAKAIWTGSKAALTSLKDGAIRLFNNMKDTISRTVTNLKTTLLTIWQAVKSKTISVVDGLKLGVKVAFEAVKTAALSIFKQVKSAIVDPITSAKDKVLGVIDKIVSAFRNMKITIPKPKLPKISVGSKKIMGVSVPTFGVDFNAKGALFKKAGMVGNQVMGEKGREVAMPVQNRRYMKPFSNAVGEQLRDDMPKSSGSVNHTEINVAQLVVREEADLQRIAKELDRIQRQQTRARGGLNFA